MLPGSHHAGGVEVSDFVAIELYDADAVVYVLPLSQAGLDGGDADGIDALDHAVLAEIPQREVDVVDVAVDKDAAGELGVVDKEARGVEFVAGLGAEDGGAADAAVVHALKGVAVGGVEAAGEATEDFEVWAFVCCVDYGL